MIVDFQDGGGTEDLIHLSTSIYGSLGAVMSHVSYGASGAVVDLGGGNSVTLVGVRSGVDTSDFVLF